MSRLVQAAAAGEADEELAAAVTPARLSKLHRRLTGETTTSDSAGLAAAANASSRPGVGAGAGDRVPAGLVADPESLAGTATTAAVTQRRRSRACSPRRSVRTFASWKPRTVTGWRRR